VIERRLSRFLREPVSVRNAMGVIASATTVVVLVGAAVMRAADGSEYPDFGRAAWWAIQTVTTVGYGDVTPRELSGRIVATALMLWGVAFLAIVTALITSTFIERARRERQSETAADEAQEEKHVDDRLDDLAARLDRIEQALAKLTSG
jgi:voltage-gated potassium channel